jgi:hypothetical protein
MGAIMHNANDFPYFRASPTVSTMLTHDTKQIIIIGTATIDTA